MGKLLLVSTTLLVFGFSVFASCLPLCCFFSPDSLFPSPLFSHDANSCRCKGSADQSVEVAMVNGHTFPEQECPASQTAGGYITEQCRPFQYFSEKNLEVCFPFLSNTSTYYLLDSPDLDTYPHSYVAGMADLMKTVLNAECLSNVLAVVCHSWFRECREVSKPTGDEKTWVPSLLCRSECEKHLDVWNKCVADMLRVCVFPEL